MIQNQSSHQKIERKHNKRLGQQVRQKQRQSKYNQQYNHQQSGTEYEDEWHPLPEWTSQGYDPGDRTYEQMADKDTYEDESILECTDDQVFSSSYWFCIR